MSVISPIHSKAPVQFNYEGAFKQAKQIKQAIALAEQGKLVTNFPTFENALFKLKQNWTKLSDNPSASKSEEHQKLGEKLQSLSTRIEHLSAPKETKTQSNRNPATSTMSQIGSLNLSAPFVAGWNILSKGGSMTYRAGASAYSTAAGWSWSKTIWTVLGAGIGAAIYRNPIRIATGMFETASNIYSHLFVPAVEEVAEIVPPIMEETKKVIEEVSPTLTQGTKDAKDAYQKITQNLGWGVKAFQSINPAVDCLYENNVGQCLTDWQSNLPPTGGSDEKDPTIRDYANRIFQANSPVSNEEAQVTGEAALINIGVHAVALSSLQTLGKTFLAPVLPQKIAALGETATRTIVILHLASSTIRPKGHAEMMSYLANQANGFLEIQPGKHLPNITGALKLASDHGGTATWLSAAAAGWGCNKVGGAIPGIICAATAGSGADQLFNDGALTPWIRPLATEVATLAAANPTTTTLLGTLGAGAACYPLGGPTASVFCADVAAGGLDWGLNNGTLTSSLKQDYPQATVLLGAAKTAAICYMTLPPFLTPVCAIGAAYEIDQKLYDGLVASSTAEMIQTHPAKVTTGASSSLAALGAFFACQKSGRATPATCALAGAATGTVALVGSAIGSDQYFNNGFNNGEVATYLGQLPSNYPGTTTTLLSTAAGSAGFAASRQAGLSPRVTTEVTALATSIVALIGAYQILNQGIPNQGFIGAGPV